MKEYFRVWKSISDCETVCQIWKSRLFQIVKEYFTLWNSIPDCVEEVLRKGIPDCEK